MRGKNRRQSVGDVVDREGGYGTALVDSLPLSALCLVKVHEDPYEYCYSVRYQVRCFPAPSRVPTTQARQQTKGKPCSHKG